jgi:hypothetical protein
MTGSSRRFDSPAALRRAVTAGLKAKAESSRWTRSQPQRQMAYDRLRERLYLVDDDWIVKAATALLARDIGVRATIDIDVYRQTARAGAEAHVYPRGRHAQYCRLVPLRDRSAAVCYRCRCRTASSVAAYIGTTRWAALLGDLVGSDLRMTGDSEQLRL